MNLIQIKNLCFSYPTKKDTLKHINFGVDISFSTGILKIKPITPVINTEIKI